MLHSPKGTQIAGDYVQGDKLTTYVNSQRGLSKPAGFEKDRKDGLYVLRIIFTQTPGIWDAGVELVIQCQTTGPYKEAEIVSGMPPVRVETVQREKERGVFIYRSSTPPLKDMPVVLEFLSESEIGVARIATAPQA